MKQYYNDRLLSFQKVRLAVFLSVICGFYVGNILFGSFIGLMILLFDFIFLRKINSNSGRCRIG